MDYRNWIHPFEIDGRRRDYDDIPQTVTGFVDDLFRSLAGELRRAGGFAKDTIRSANSWADFLRRRVKRKIVEATSIARWKGRRSSPRATHQTDPPGRSWPCAESVIGPVRRQASWPLP